MVQVKHQTLKDKVRGSTLRPRSAFLVFPDPETRTVSSGPRNNPRGVWVHVVTLQRKTGKKTDGKGTVEEVGVSTFPAAPARPRHDTGTHVTTSGVSSVSKGVSGGGTSDRTNY